MNHISEIVSAVGSALRRLYYGDPSIMHPPESQHLREAIARNRDAQVENVRAGLSASNALDELLRDMNIKKDR